MRVLVTSVSGGYVGELVDEDGEVVARTSSPDMSELLEQLQWLGEFIDELGKLRYAVH